MSEAKTLNPARNAKDASVRSLIVPLDGAALLIPNALVSEVAPFQTPTPVNGPQWVLGKVQWRGLAVPLISMEALAGLPGGKPVRTSRAIVLNTLNGDPLMPFIVVLSRGIPRMQAVVAGMLPEASESGSDGILCRFEYNREKMFIPDLDRIERLLLHRGLVVERGEMTTEKVR